MHQLFNTRREVVEVDIEKIDVAGSQLRERAFDTKANRLAAVSCVEDLLLDGWVGPRPADTILERRNIIQGELIEV